MRIEEFALASVLSVSLELWDWRRRMSELYADARATRDRAAACERWREGRGALFGSHPQSPLAAGGAPLSWFPYAPEWRVEAGFEPEPSAAAPRWETAEGFFHRIGSLVFDAPPGSGVLAVWWLDAYAGGVFVPFRDATAGATTYGGGRYLIDTAKGADLGHTADRVVLDFNFAYHPSCAYDPAWPCPLAPAENRLGFAVEAGGRLSVSR